MKESSAKSDLREQINRIEDKLDVLLRIMSMPSDFDNPEDFPYWDEQNEKNDIH
jgi:hypothetical protein